MLPPTFWIPKGAKPAGIPGSTNAPGMLTSPKLPSKTSTLPLWKSVAYSRSPAIARPLKIASSPDLSTTTWAVVPSDGFQPRIFPSSVANRKSAGPLPTTKLGPVLATAPVGAFGTETTSGLGVPSAVYSVETSVPLSATHHGEPGSDVRPHAFTRFASTWSAAIEPSETRLCWTYAFCSAAGVAAASTAAMKTSAATAIRARWKCLLIPLPSLGGQKGEYVPEDAPDWLGVTSSSCSVRSSPR